MSPKSPRRRRPFRKRVVVPCAAVVYLLVALSTAVAQRAPTSVPQAPITGGSGEYGDLPFVNSSAVRLRDFPSITEGRILGILSEGQPLEISATTRWKDRTDGGAFSWYHVAVVNKRDLVGWVYGEYISSGRGQPIEGGGFPSVSRQEMNRPLLVLEMFRHLLGTESGEVATSRLQGLAKAPEVHPQIGFPSEYSLRDYKSDFGELIVRFDPQKERQLVLSIALDRPESGLLVTVGEPVSRVRAVLGLDYYSQGQTLFYRAIPGVESYGVTVRTAKDVVTAITASALVE